MKTFVLLAIIASAGCATVVGVPDGGTDDDGGTTEKTVVIIVENDVAMMEPDDVGSQQNEDASFIDNNPKWTPCAEVTEDTTSCDVVCASIGSVTTNKTCSNGCGDGLKIWCGSDSCQDSQEAPGLPYYLQCSSDLIIGGCTANNADGATPSAQSFQCCCQ